MKIVIIGAGAMGCLYGAKISALDKNEVWLLDVFQEHVDSINKKGLLMEENGEVIVYDKVKASTDPSEVGPCDLAIVFVKSTITGMAIEANKAVFHENTIALTLQNGLGNVDEISKIIGSEHVIAGTTAHGATMIEAGKIKHAGSGKTIIGELDGSKSERIENIACLLKEVGMETEVSENVMGLIWDKLLVNVGINALTAITELQNGKLAEIPELAAILEKAVEEGEAVAKAKGIVLNTPDPIKHTKKVCIATAENKSSMLQDILRKKVTEINMINGAIVREGEAAGVLTPVNEVLTNLIKWKQSIK